MSSVESAGCVSKSIYQQFAEIEQCCDFSEVARSAKRSPTGKRLPGALYVHVSALLALEQPLQDYENLARHHLKKLDGATLVKFNTDQPKVSYLSYPDFDTEAHPALQWSVQVDLVTSQVAVRNYNSADNPPVLHRKEIFVTSDYSLYQPFAELTRQEEALGLLNQGPDGHQRWGLLLPLPATDFLPDESQPIDPPKLTESVGSIAVVVRLPADDRGSVVCGLPVPSESGCSWGATGGFR